MTRFVPTTLVRVLGAFACAATLLSCAPEDGHAQVAPAMAGGVIGAAGGFLVSAAWVTAESRSGRFLYSTEDLRWQLLPIPLAVAGGAILGYQNDDRLWSAVGDGAAGLALGAVVGAGAGALVWGDSEGAWAGAVLGGATGLLVGAVVGSTRWTRSIDQPAPQLTLRIPVVW